MKKTITVLGVVTFVILGVFMLLVKSVYAQDFEATLMPPKYELELDPGEVIQRNIEIRNDSEAGNVTFYILKSDLEAEDETGKPRFVQHEDEASFSLASWMSFDKESVTLRRGETGRVLVTITVPEDAEAGGHYGAVWFTTVPENVQGTSGVGLASNFVALILTNIKGDVYEDVQVTKFETEKKIYQSLPVSFDSKIQNDGNTHYKPLGGIRITNRITKKEYYIQYNKKGSNVLPGVSKTFTDEWVEIKEDKELLPKIGLYDAELRLAGDVAFVKNNNVSITFWVLPPKILIGALIVIVVIIVIFRIYGMVVVNRSKKRGK